MSKTAPSRLFTEVARRLVRLFVAMAPTFLVRRSVALNRVGPDESESVGPDESESADHDPVEDAGRASFPASDSPAWTGMHLGPARHHVSPDDVA